MRFDPIAPQQFVSYPGARWDTGKVITPPAARAEAAVRKLGLEYKFNVKPDGSVGIFASDLRLDVELETKEHGQISVRDALALDEVKNGGKLRCQSPFRDSSSFAAYLALNRSGKPFVHDVGTSTNHYLTDHDWAALCFSDTDMEPDGLFTYAAFTTLETDPPPPREWVWDRWLPRGTVVALFGRGGIGKSLLVQQLATHIAHGVQLGGHDVVKSTVLGYFCEDDNDELRRRQQSIASQLFITPDEMTDLHLEGRAGKANTLLTFGQDKLPKPTPLLAELSEECRNYQPGLLILDNVAQMYAGLENDRYQVTAFCNELTGLAREHNLCVLLLGHVAKAEGSEYSGSTAWEAAVRTRLWLDRTDAGLLQLHRKKANYADQDSITLEYQSGYLRSVGAAVDAAPLMAKAMQPRILEAILHYTAQEIATSNTPTARNYLVRMMLKDGRAAGTSQPVLAQALSSLIATGKVKPNAELGWKKPDRHPAIGLEVVSEKSK